MNRPGFFGGQWCGDGREPACAEDGELRLNVWPQDAKDAVHGAFRIRFRGFRGVAEGEPATISGTF